MTSKRIKAWTPIVEEIVILFIDLAVEGKKKVMINEVLRAYRLLTQNNNITSLSKVVEYLLDTAENLSKKAQLKAKKFQETQSQGSLEAMLVVGVIALEDKEKKSVSTSWIKFLCETYRTVLDLLRTNLQLEPLYHV